VIEESGRLERQRLRAQPFSGRRLRPWQVHSPKGDLRYNSSNHLTSLPITRITKSSVAVSLPFYIELDEFIRTMTTDGEWDDKIGRWVTALITPSDGRAQAAFRCLWPTGLKGFVTAASAGDRRNLYARSVEGERIRPAIVDADLVVTVQRLLFA
jgi:hypothetical protein